MCSVPRQSVTSSIFLGSRRQECHRSHPREDTSNSSISRGHESEVGAHWVQDRGLQNLPQKGSRKLPRFRPMPCHDAPSQQLPIHPGQLDYLIPSGRHLVGLSAICAGSGDQTARGMRPILAGVGTGSRYQGRVSRTESIEEQERIERTTETEVARPADQGCQTGRSRQFLL